MMDLAATRRQVRAARRALSPDAQADAAELVASAVSRLVAAPAWVGIYVATDGEVDPEPLARRWCAAGTRVALPAVLGDSLVFAEDLPDRRLPGPFGIAEPTGPPVALAQLDVLLVPLVLFDARCDRVGRGAGYYDRILGAVGSHDRPPHGGPLLVGLAHDLQEVSQLTPAAHDVAMDAIVTPTRTFLRR